ncbi:GntR family transcriptional regulator [Azospirillum brasilense]|uniref:GntR family transcriptional regulator n=1 Tax=Azospirillum brasilense TaxID=192 RepID=A0A0P0F7F5_AZOBR|nr:MULTISPECIES: GntR family transcriptional regulator [Azospirillum]ALJ39228.1 GntR family transcriptional regulator [Azospirillum brasilense]MDW7556888.1 GntR family transcriptional regulator [Azospirillum brasilense]MDW7596657.1 GntR family transcriptional regulator [Azospirillum brasilense]MDW7631538.1 GntR family transcriptional regulator [Azospirillum brasilense]MDX5950347.1 GntR family transcriptional regulator [Azospirillum brasilense]
MASNSRRALDAQPPGTAPGTVPGKVLGTAKEPRLSARATATAEIYRSLRGDIVAMRRKPGEPIVEKHVAESFGVSRTPVREALLRLADDGLVEIFPQSGTFVSRIPVNALPEAVVIRTSLECTAVRYAAVRAARSQIAALRANILLQQETMAAGDLDGFHEADEAFHSLISEIAGFPGLWNMAQQVKMQVDRYRRLTLPEPGRIPHVLAEHGGIVDAIAARDPAEAERLMTIHLGALLESVPNTQGANPFFFSGAQPDDLSKTPPKTKTESTPS